MCSIDCRVVIVFTVGVIVVCGGGLTGNIPYLNFSRDIRRSDWNRFRDKVWISRLLYG